MAAPEAHAVGAAARSNVRLENLTPESTDAAFGIMWATNSTANSAVVWRIMPALYL